MEVQLRMLAQKREMKLVYKDASRQKKINAPTK
jgi:hypothetical protein